MNDSGRRVSVVSRRGFGAKSWKSRHRESAVPSLWPYGLDGLDGQGIDLTSREYSLYEEKLQRRAPLVVRTLWPVARVNRADVALCWDERTAVIMNDLIRARRKFSGVIWATDGFRSGHTVDDLPSITSALQKCDGLWVNSSAQVDVIDDWLGTSSPMVHYIPFGIDNEFYKYSTYPMHKHVVSMGIDRDRDPATLLAALEIVHRARPDVRISIQSRSDQSFPDGITRVPFMSHVQARSLLSSASVVAIATQDNVHMSGLTTGLESLSTGRPVVISDTPGANDYFEDDVARRTGAGDASSMADAIIDLLDRPEVAEEMGRIGSERVAERFTTAVMCDELRQLILQ